MIANSDTSLTEAVSFMARYRLNAGYLVPTETGLGKNILDATLPVREFLVGAGIHDFSQQPKGSGSKVEIEISLVKVDSVEKRRLSLYRPETKKGDPRLWISKLNNFAKAGNLLALIGNSTAGIFVINMSDKKVLEKATDTNSPIHQTIKMVTEVPKNPSAIKLRGLLEGVSSKGFIESLRPGDTGVGFTLETLLGIRENASRQPDFEGIEIKSKRASSSTKSTLFSQVPDYQCSLFRSHDQLLEEFGYPDLAKSRLSLKITLNEKPFSAAGTGKYLYLNVSDDSQKLYLKERLGDGTNREILEWQMDFLKWRLGTKHAETFWVEAKTQKTGKLEKFHYVAATHTQTPFLENLPLLLDTGVITLDITAHKDLHSGKEGRNHGMIFKIAKKNFGALFPPSYFYDLVNGTFKVK